MQKQQVFEENYSNAQSQPKKRQHIKKDTRRKDKRKRQAPKQQVQQAKEAIQQPQQQLTNNFASFQSQTSKYQRLDEFWRVDIESLYRKQFTEEDKTLLANVLNEKKPSLVEVFKDKQRHLWDDKISLEQLYKYLELIVEFSGNQEYTFVVLEAQHNKREHFVLVLDQQRAIEKAVEVTQEEMTLLAFRQQCIQNIKKKNDFYNRTLGKHEKLSEINLEITFLVNYLNWVKTNLDTKLQELDERAKNQPQFQPPVQVEENYISFLIKKNLKKALQDEEIDYFNHFKKLDINEHQTGLIDLKPITEKKEFQEFIRKRKIKKTGKKARWVLKTACGACLSYHHEMYNPLSFCSQCHIRYHRYCYIPKNEGICDSCFMSKNNQTKRSRINECQLCGTRGFLYLSMDESSNAHIFCLLINGLWKFQNTQIIFQKRHIENAVENVNCAICKQSNSCIYKCECCLNYAHPLCAYLSGWGLKQQASGQTGNEIVKLQCCNGVEREQNQKRRRFVLNYKRCVFSQCQ